MSNDRLVLWICIPILVINLFRWNARAASPAAMLIEEGTYDVGAKYFQVKVGQDLANGMTSEELTKKYGDITATISNAEDSASMRKKTNFVFYTLGCLALLWVFREIEQVSIGLGITTAASFFDWGCLGIEFIVLAPLLILVVPAIGFGKLFDKLK